MGEVSIVVAYFQLTKNNQMKIDKRLFLLYIGSVFVSQHPIVGEFSSQQTYCQKFAHDRKCGLSCRYIYLKLSNRTVNGRSHHSDTSMKIGKMLVVSYPVFVCSGTVLNLTMDIYSRFYRLPRLKHPKNGNRKLDHLTIIFFQIIIKRNRMFLIQFYMRNLSRA